MGFVVIDEAHEGILLKALIRFVETLHCIFLELHLKGTGWGGIQRSRSTTGLMQDEQAAKITWSPEQEEENLMKACLSSSLYLSNVSK